MELIYFVLLNIERYTETDDSDSLSVYRRCRFRLGNATNNRSGGGVAWIVSAVIAAALSYNARRWLAINLTHYDMKVFP